MKIKATLHDSEGKEIDPTMCICGKPGTIQFQSAKSFIWMCQACVYPTNKNCMVGGFVKEEDLILGYKGKFPEQVGRDKE